VCEGEEGIEMQGSGLGIRRLRALLRCGAAEVGGGDPMKPRGVLILGSLFVLLAALLAADLAQQSHMSVRFIIEIIFLKIFEQPFLALGLFVIVAGVIVLWRNRRSR
jgi:hypothetical protein